MDDEIIRIMVSSDNHLGYAERDPVRGDDSFAAFEEVLARARLDKADFVLLAGDLFHENKPSRRTLFIAMELFRKYSLGNEPVFTEVLNQEKEVFRSNHGSVNYEDPYLSVSLPIFAIHGNHDDPSREGGQGDALAALDLLSINNIVNYIGKTNKVDDIEITPVLMKKGETYVAIYALGAIRDERLNRMWQLKNIRFIRPSAQYDGGKFFNILLLHQNRDYGRGKKDCVHESMIPEWMDLVIWGNAHESKPYLAESLVGTFRIFQPGSSVATSCSELESVKYPKHFGLIEIRSDKKFRMIPKRYNSIRPFLYAELSLDEAGFNSHDPKIEENIKSFLTRKVAAMIQESKSLVENIKQNENPDLIYHLKDPSSIIIRLRVDPCGLPTINQQRFGSQFVGKVGNASEILQYSRKRKESHKANAMRLNEKMEEMEENDEKDEANDDGILGGVHKIKVEELVVDALTRSNRNLTIIPQGDLTIALEDYVQRKHANAFLDTINETLAQTQQELYKNCMNASRENIVKAVVTVKDRAEDQLRKGLRVRQNNNRVIVYSDDEDNNEAEDGRAETRPTRGGPGRGSRGGRGGRGAAAKAEAPKKSTAKSKETAATTKRSSGRATKMVTYAESEGEDEVVDAEDDDGIEPLPSKARHENSDDDGDFDNNNDFDDDSDVVKPKSGRASTKVAATATSKSKASNQRATTSTSSKSKIQNIDLMEDDEDDLMEISSRKQTSSSSRKRPAAQTTVEKSVASKKDSKPAGIDSYFSQMKSDSDWG